MPLITQLKMGAVNNLSDARCAAGFDAAFLGFCLDPEDNHFIPPEQIQQIINWIDGPEIVGEFGKQQAEKINQLATELNFKYIQLNYYDPDFQFESIDLPIIQTLNVISEKDYQKTENLFNSLASKVQFFLLSIDVKNQNGKSILNDKEFMLRLSDWCKNYKLMLDFPFNRHNILEIVKKTSAFGINIKGGNELKPGYRDFDELIEMIELLEIN